MNLSQYREDLNKQKNGTPIYVGDAIFYIKRLGTPESTKAIKKISNRLFGPLHQYTQEDDYEKIAAVLAEYAVVNWENVYWSFNDEKEKREFEFNEENKYKLFYSDEFKLSLNVILWNEAWKFENFLYEEAEDSIEEIKKP